LSPQDVADLYTNSDCWVIVDNKVYDVTDFIPAHPGGARMLLNFAGRDATAASRPFHAPPRIAAALPAHKHLGELD
ncbi:predicted protein, partial [Postia placenta Mad-698-R]